MSLQLIFNPFDGNFQYVNSTTGSVTSVGLADGSTIPIYTVSGSPVTSSGILTLTLINQAANTVFAGPASGSSAQPTVRSLVAADLPNLSSIYVTQSEVGAANGVASLDGSGKVPSSQLPSTVLEYQGLWNPATNTPILQDSTGTNGFVYQVSAAFAGPIVGLSSPTMVNFQVGNLVLYSSASGQWQQADALTGVTSVNGAQGAVIVNAINELTGDGFAGPSSGSQSQSLTLATVNSNIGSFTNASLTVNAKGLVTAAANGTAPVTTITASSPLFSSGGSTPNLTIQQSTTSQDGYLSAIDWITFNNKQSALTFGNLTDSTSGIDGITITGGTAAIIGSGATIAQQAATTTQNGYLTSTDWNTFNSKQTAGSYITALTGQIAASGPGSSVATIVTNTVTNSNLAQMATNTIKGNNVGSTANASDLTVAQVNAILPIFTNTLNGLAPLSGGGSNNYLRADGTWNIPSGTGVSSITVASSNGFAGSSSGSSAPILTLSTTVNGILFGNGTSAAAAIASNFPILNQNTTGTAANITATSNSTLTTLSSLSLPTSQLSGQIVASQLPDIPADTILGNNTGSPAIATALTVDQVNAILPIFTSSLNGLTPASGGGTVNFLRADGTWDAPAGTGTVTSVAMTVPTFLSVAGSPITSSGTLAITLSGTPLPAINGGTGAPNTGTLTYGSNNLTFTTSGTTSLTLPTSGTVAITTPGDISETTFVLANNVSTPTNITSLAFASTVKMARVDYAIVINATTSLFEAGTLLLCNIGNTSWQLAGTSVGNQSSVVFSITSAGQVQYVDANYTGFSGGAISFRAWAL